MTQAHVDDLIDAITTTVAPESWNSVGGPGAISRIGGSLAILQTPTIHALVQEFLRALQRESGTLRTLSIHAHWLSLDNEQLAKLTADDKPTKRLAGNQAVNPQALATLLADTQRYAGRISCLNGQTVHIISGQLETVVQGAIPVVGGTLVGYQPLLLRPHLGALLQITPTLLPDQQAVLIDLHNTITRGGEPDSPVVLGSKRDDPPSVQIDRMKLAVQQFSTTLQVPLSKPILVGGMTSTPDEGQQQLSLIIEVQSHPEP